MHTQQSLFRSCLKFQIWLHLDFFGMGENSIFLIHYKTIFIFYKEKHFLFLKKCIFFVSKNRSWSLTNGQSIKSLVALVKGLHMGRDVDFVWESLGKILLFVSVLWLYKHLVLSLWYSEFISYYVFVNRYYCQVILILGIILCVVRYFSF